MLNEGNACMSHSTLTIDTVHCHFICGESKNISKDINQGPVSMFKIQTSKPARVF
jgi:hypothetical protein